MEQDIHTESLYSSEIAQEVFKEILSTLDHITPLFIDRNEFSAKEGKILEENGENKA